MVVKSTELREVLEFGNIVEQGLQIVIGDFALERGDKGPGLFDVVTA